MRSKLLAAVAVLAAMALTTQADDSLKKGTPEIKSITAMAFSPTGTLFVGDPTAATIFAIDTGDKAKPATSPVNIERLDAKVAGLIGATEKDLTFNDMKVNPATGAVYLAVTRGKTGGTPVIVRVNRTEGAPASRVAASPVELVTLKDVPFSKVTLPNPADGKNSASVITSMSFVDNKLVVAGLSKEDFASTLRTIPYPFKEVDKGAGIQIFHGAHGKIETHAPIRTFTTQKVGKEETILAAYTCTPLVKIPVGDLKAGAKVKGTTIAELGNRNNPIDMITYTKDGKDYILMANSARGVMKIPTAGADSAEAITTRPAGDTAGLKYETITSLKGVMQLDKLDDTHALLLVKTDAGFDLKTIDLP